MNNFADKNKWQLRVITLGLFLIGFCAGVFTLNAYHLIAGAEKSPTKRERYQEAFGQLNLNETQNIEVQKIVAETRESIQILRQESEPRIKELRRRSDARLQTVMTAEQWKKFEILRESIRYQEK